MAARGLRHDRANLSASIHCTGIVFSRSGLHLARQGSHFSARAYTWPGLTLGPGLHLARAYSRPGHTLGTGLHLARAYTWHGPTLGPGLHLARAYSRSGLTLGALPEPTFARAYTWLGPTLYSVLAWAYITSLLWLGSRAHPWHGSL